MTGDQPDQPDRPTPSDQPDRLGDALAAALSERAATVAATASTDARAAVDRRIGRRASARRTRRALVATASAVTAVVLVAGAVILSADGHDDQPEVATNDGDQATTTTAATVPDYAVGDSSDDPTDFGLPMIGFDEDLGLTLEDPPSPVVTTEEIGPSIYGYSQIQVFRQRDQVTPLVVAPWIDPTSSVEHRPGGNSPESTEPVLVNGTTATLDTDASGWLTLAWTLPDGTPALLFSFGVDAEALRQLATDLVRDADGSGYGAANLPEGFYAEEFLTPTPDTPSAGYVLRYRRGNVGVQLEVRHESRERQEERVIMALAGISSAENVDVFGKVGFEATMQSGRGPTTVAWAEGPDITANVVINGATPAEIDEIVAGLRELTPDAWSDSLSRG